MKKSLAFVLGASILAVTACSSVSTTGSDVALQYSAGPFDTRQFKKCWSENQKDIANDPGDDYFYYPAGQRDYDFGDGDDKDSAAFTSTTKDGQELKIQGVVKFELNAECKEYTDSKGKKWPGGVLQYMHENFTNQRQAYGSEGGAMNQPSWSKFLTSYLGASIDRAIDNSSLKFNWQELYQDQDVKAKWESTVKGEAESIVKTLTQDVPIFKVTAVVLQKPDVGKELKDGLSAKQAAILQKEATDIVANAGATFPGGVPAYQKFLQEQAINKAIEQGKAQIYVVPNGTGVMMGK